MIFIDLAGLGTEPINPYALIRAYNLSGYLLPPERRLAVLKRTREDATPHLVYTGPEGAEFWRGAPAHIQVRIIPGDAEVGRRLKEPAISLTAIVPDDLQGFEQVGEGASTQAAPYHYKIVDNALALAEFAKLLGEHNVRVLVGLDTEATSEDDRTAEMVGLGLSFSKEQNFYLPARSKAGVLALDAFKQQLPRFSYVAHNAKYDYKILKRHGYPIDLAHLAGDGMIAAYVLAEVDRQGMPLPKGLKWLSEEHLGIHQPSFVDMMASAGVDNVWDIPLDIIGRYCAGDAFLCVQIERLLLDKLVDKGLDKIYQKLELPNVIFLAEMELLGLPVDVPAARDRRKMFSTRVTRYRDILETMATKAGWSKTVSKSHHGKLRKPIKDCVECDDRGRIQVLVPFNPGSRFHVGELLQDTLGLPLLKVATDDVPANDKLVLLQLEQMADSEDTKLILGTLLAERKTTKILGTYLMPLTATEAHGLKQPQQVFPSSAFGQDIMVIRPRYNQTVVASPRLSSEDPNAQNQPLSIRDLYRAPPGTLFWDADYGQLELRIMASVSRCKAMIEAFQRGEDIHALTGWRVFGIRPADLTKTMRVRCKTLNFGVSYEAEAEAVYKQILKAALEYPELNIEVPTIAECRHLIAEYWKAYPEVREFREIVHALVEERGYSETIYGWRRNLPLIYSPVPELKARAQRQGWNLVIQGTAGQIIKNSELMVWHDAPEFHADVRSQVHDELLGLVEHAYAEPWLERVKRLMVLDQPIMPVPLVVDAHVGPTWLEAK